MKASEIDPNIPFYCFKYRFLQDHETTKSEYSGPFSSHLVRSRSNFDIVMVATIVLLRWLYNYSAFNRTNNIYAL